MNADDDKDRSRRSHEAPEVEPPPDTGVPSENTLGRKFAWPEFAWPEAAGKSPDILGFGESNTAAPGEEPETPEPTPIPATAPAERYLGEFAQDRRYRGVRRADRLADRHWPVIGAALAAVSVALAVLIIVASMPMRHNASIPNGMGGTGTSVAPNTPQSTAPTNSTGAPPTGTAGPSPTQKMVPPPKRATPNPTAMRPTTYEAEQPGNLISGTAAVLDYPGASGGKIVRNIGNWDDPAGPGALTFTHVSVPANGVYTMRFFYVHLDNQASRTVVVTIATVGSFSITVTGNSVCCASKAVAIPLQKGINDITFANPNGHAPSLDKIVISAL